MILYSRGFQLLRFFSMAAYSPFEEQREPRIAPSNIPLFGPSLSPGHLSFGLRPAPRNIERPNLAQVGNYSGYHLP